MLTGDNGGRIRTWSVPDRAARVLRGHVSFVYPVSVAPDGRTLLSGDWDGFTGERGCLRVWDFDSGECVAALGEPTEFVPRAHVLPGSARAVAQFSVDRGRSTVEMVDLRTGRRTIVEEAGPLSGLTLFDVSPAGNEILVGDSLEVRRVEIETGGVTRVRGVPRRRSDSIRGTGFFNAARWSPDGQWIAIVHSSGQRQRALVHGVSSGRRDPRREEGRYLRNCHRRLGTRSRRIPCNRRRETTPVKEIPRCSRTRV